MQIKSMLCLRREVDYFKNKMANRRGQKTCIKLI